MIKKINFLDIPLDILTMDETVNKIDKAIISNKQVHHCVINAGKVVKIQNDEILKESVINSDIINADGMSIVWSVRFLGYKIEEIVLDEKTQQISATKIREQMRKDGKL